MKPTRFYSNKQEKTVAKSLGGKKVANSGATSFNKGDVIAGDFLIECKTTTATSKASFSIKREWLEKNREEAFAMGKHHNALAFQYGEGKENYYVLDERQFKEYMFLLEEEKR